MILTLGNIRDRCKVDEDTGCWLWRSRGDSGGHPRARDESGAVVSVRRRVWELAHNETMTNGQWNVVSACAQETCVSPTCAKRLTAKQFVAHLMATTSMHGPAHAAAKTAAHRAKPDLKLNAAQAAELRARIQAGECRGKVAAEFGISRNYANLIARGKRWAPMRGSSVFALGAV